MTRATDTASYRYKERLRHQHRFGGGGTAVPGRWPLPWSTARRPNCRLSLEMSSVTVVTLPTLISLVQSGDVVSRVTTWYPARLDSGLAFQLSVVVLVPEKLTGAVAWICTFLGV